MFVGVPLAEAARAAVVELVEGVRDEVDRVAREPRSAVRWVRMDGLHLTLRFLGAVPADNVPVIADAVGRAAAAAWPFGLTIGGAGAFPSPSRPRTIWLGISGGAAELAQLASRLDDELEGLGWPRETRPFRAHLTLARADGRREGPLVARMLTERARGLAVDSDVDRAVLFRSVTGGGPARYVPLAESHLAGP